MNGTSSRWERRDDFVTAEEGNDFQMIRASGEATCHGGTVTIKNGKIRTRDWLSHDTDYVVKVEVFANSAGQARVAIEDTKTGQILGEGRNTLIKQDQWIHAAAHVPGGQVAATVACMDGGEIACKTVIIDD